MPDEDFNVFVFMAIELEIFLPFTLPRQYATRNTQHAKCEPHKIPFWIDLVKVVIFNGKCSRKGNEKNR